MQWIVLTASCFVAEIAVIVVLGRLSCRGSDAEVPIGTGSAPRTAGSAQDDGGPSAPPAAGAPASAG